MSLKNKIESVGLDSIGTIHIRFKMSTKNRIKKFLHIRSRIEFGFMSKSRFLQSNKERLVSIDSYEYYRLLRIAQYLNAMADRGYCKHEKNDEHESFMFKI